MGYFAAQMLLDKSFRVLHTWKGAAAVTAGFLLLFAVVAFDLTGYENRIPDTDDVASVEISGLGGGAYDSGNHLDEIVTDPAVVEKVIALHRAAVDMQELTHEDVDWDGDHNEWWNVSIRYTLKNGTVIARKYSLTDWASRKDTPGSFWYAADQLVSDRAFMWRAYGFERAAELESQGAWLEDAEFNVREYAEKYLGYTGDYSDSLCLSGEDARALLAAVKADFAAGRIGRKSAEVDTEEILGMLWFRWQVPGGVSLWRESVTSAAPILGYSYAEPEIYREDTSWFYVEILVTPEATETLAVLEDLMALLVIEEGNVNYDVMVEIPGGQSR